MENKDICAGLYIRVSTIQQVDKDSLHTQEERLINHCKYNSINNYYLYEDAGVSAKDINRSSLKKLLDDIKTGKINAVYVTKLDRITRSLPDLLELVKYFDEHDIQFVSLVDNIDSTTAIGRFMQQLLGLLAQLEREITAERVSIDMYHRAKQGKWNGGIVPNGYTTYNRFLIDNKEKYPTHDELKDAASKLCPSLKKLYIDPQEAKIIQLIFSTFIKLNSIRGTTHFLNDSGIKTRNNKLWATSSIHRILSNPIYIGKITYGKRKTHAVSGKLIHMDKCDWTVVDGGHKGIIDIDVFEKAQKMLMSKYIKPTKSDRIYLLRGILRCKICGGKMNGYSFTKKNGKRYSYYKCWSHQQKGNVACIGMSLPADKLEEFIICTLMDLSKNKQLLIDRKKMLETAKQHEKSHFYNDSFINLTNQEILAKKKLERLILLYEDGKIEKEDFTPHYIKAKDEISTIQNNISNITYVINNNEILRSIIEESFDKLMSFENSWDLLDEVGKKLRIDSIVKEITADQETVDINVYFDEFNIVSNMLRDSWPLPA